MPVAQPPVVKREEMARKPAVAGLPPQPKAAPLTRPELLEFARKFPPRTPFRKAALNLSKMMAHLKTGNTTSFYYDAQEMGLPLKKTKLTVADVAAAAHDAQAKYYLAKGFIDKIQELVDKAETQRNPRGTVARTVYEDLTGQRVEEARLGDLKNDLQAMRQAAEALWKRKGKLDERLREWRKGGALQPART